MYTFIIQEYIFATTLHSILSCKKPRNQAFIWFTSAFFHLGKWICMRLIRLGDYQFFVETQINQSDKHDLEKVLEMLNAILFGLFQDSMRVILNE